MKYLINTLPSLYRLFKIEVRKIIYCNKEYFCISFNEYFHVPFRVPKIDGQVRRNDAENKIVTLNEFRYRTSNHFR